MEKDILDELKNKRINPENLKDLSEDDRMYFYINAGVLYIAALNTIDRGIGEHEKIIRSLVPEPIEDVKILLSRTADIDPKEIPDLSAGFLENLFTVNGRVLKINLPEIGEVEETEFKRFVVEQIKSSDEEVATAIDIKKQIVEMLEADIPPEAIEIIKDVFKMDEWMINYFKKQIAKDEVDEKEKKMFAKKLAAREESYTLKPLMDNIKEVIAKKSTTDSILHGFYNDNKRVLTAAVEACAANNITFPFQLFAGIQDILFGEEKYKDYKNLLLYLWARYLKYKGKNINDYDRIFITNFHTHIVMIKRGDKWKEYPKFSETLKNSIREILDTVINYRTKKK